MKKIEEIISIISKIDFSYSGGISYDYDRVEAYDHDERCADDYCRCSSLENFSISSISGNEFVNYIKSYLGVEHSRFDNDIFNICEKLTTDDFEFEVSGGYYGEELDSITLENYGVIEKLAGIFSIKGYRKAKLNQIYNNTEHDNLELDAYVKKLLTEEYGYVIDVLDNHKFKIIDIDTKDIVFPQKEYDNFIKVQELCDYKNIDDICGLVRFVGNKYHVIDGYHRINANINKPKLKVILAYK
jgi:uncharacterized protein YwgA